MISIFVVTKFWIRLAGNIGQFIKAATAAVPPCNGMMGIMPGFQPPNPGCLYIQTIKFATLLPSEFPALHAGDFVPLNVSHGLLAYLRRTEEQSILVAMNFTTHSVKLKLPDGNWNELFSSKKISQSASTLLAPHEVRLLIKK